MKPVIIGLLIVTVVVSGQKLEVTEEELESVVKPCIIDDICPDGQSLDYDTIQGTLGFMKLATIEQTNSLPKVCEDDCSSEKCDRVCFYALVKMMFRYQKESSGAARRKRIRIRSRLA